MVFVTEQKIIKIFMRLLIIFLAAVIFLLLNFKLFIISIIFAFFGILFCFFVFYYLKSTSFFVSKKILLLKKGVFFKTEYYIPNKNNFLILKYKFLGIYLIVIKGTSFSLRLFPCKKLLCNKITECLNEQQNKT